MGYRIHKGARKGELRWLPPTGKRVRNILRHPIYAGAYAYGMRGAGQGRSDDRQGSTWFLPPDQMRVLIRDRYPAYISWEQYLGNQDKLQENRSLKRSKGVPRRGQALLPGLVICGTCGRRLRVKYRSHQVPHYACESHLVKGLETQTCWGMAAKELDALLAEQVLRALSPAALELSLAATQQVHPERERLHANWRQRLERSAQQVDRAQRQYQAVEPENRLVARTLETNWEDALRADQHLQEAYARFLTTMPEDLNQEELEQLRHAARDIGSLWESDKIDHVDRKEVIRCLIEHVVIHVQNDSERVAVTITWQGGFVTEHTIPRAVSSATQQEDNDRLIQRIHEMYNDGFTCAEMAAQLNKEGFVPPRRRNGHSKSSLAPLLRKLGLGRAPSFLGEDEWWGCDLAKELDVAHQKVYYWARQGYVHARRTAQRHWVIWADRDELQRLHKLKTHTTSWIKHRAPELIVPKDRPK